MSGFFRQQHVRSLDELQQMCTSLCPPAVLVKCCCSAGQLSNADVAAAITGNPLEYKKVLP